MYEFENWKITERSSVSSYHFFSFFFLVVWVPRKISLSTQDELSLCMHDILNILRAFMDFYGFSSKNKHQYLGIYDFALLKNKRKGSRSLHLPLFSCTMTIDEIARWLLVRIQNWCLLSSKKQSKPASLLRGTEIFCFENCFMLLFLLFFFVILSKTTRLYIRSHISLSETFF